jgi:integrase
VAPIPLARCFARSPIIASVSSTARSIRIPSTTTSSVKYGRKTEVAAHVKGLCVHLLRATAATNALDDKAYIAKVQEWLGQADVSTTRLYDRRKTRPEDNPTFRVRYYGTQAAPCSCLT